jgi:uncharacterized protein (DUF1697 family)
VTGCIALIRGINVGRAKWISMAKLRSLFVALGYQNVRTLLNSGNVLFRCARPNTGKMSITIQNAIAATCGFTAPVMVVTAADLAAIIRDNPLLDLAVDPARHLVAFAAYLWCADGLIDSKLSRIFARRAGATVTPRNWATVLKLLAASNAPP